MANFFRKKRTPLQIVGDVAVGAIRSAENGVFGSLLLSAAGNQVPHSVASLSTLAWTCALGGAVVVIPAMIAHQMLFDDPTRDNTFPAQLGIMIANTCFKAGVAFVSGCMGAAILGFAMTPVGITSLTASLTFSLISLTTRMIIEAAAPSPRTNDHFLAAMVC